MAEEKTSPGKGYQATIDILEGVTVTVQQGLVNVKGEKGESQRVLGSRKLTISTADNKVVFSVDKYNQNAKKTIKTAMAHLKNLMRGSKEGHLYKLKICSGHFPMNVAVKGNELVVKNFMGEKVPRTLTLKEGAQVNVQGDQITVESASIETAGQVSADIEKLTRRNGFDTRIFQDGIWITSKDGKNIQ